MLHNAKRVMTANVPFVSNLLMWACNVWWYCAHLSQKVKWYFSRKSCILPLLKVQSTGPSVTDVGRNVDTILANPNINKAYVVVYDVAKLTLLNNTRVSFDPDIQGIPRFLCCFPCNSQVWGTWMWKNHTAYDFITIYEKWNEHKKPSWSLFSFPQMHPSWNMFTSTHLQALDNTQSGMLDASLAIIPISGDRTNYWLNPKLALGVTFITWIPYPIHVIGPFSF